MKAYTFPVSLSGGERLDWSFEVHNLTKSYGATRALNDVSFRVPPGTIHGVVGENGAGKSTLIKIASGALQPDGRGGELRLYGSYHGWPRSVEEARRLGIATAFQELSLLPNLSVAENLALPRVSLQRRGLASRRALTENAVSWLEKYGMHEISPDAEVGSLSLPDKQRLEIVRAISHNPKILILDEPTASLSNPEWLFDILSILRKRGTTVIYISHRLNEISELCYMVTVLRNGQCVDTVKMDDVSEEEVIGMMVGSSTYSAPSKAPSVRTEGDAGIEVQGLRGRVLRETNFVLHRGEILGVVGLEGQGQSELFQILGGLERQLSGYVRIDGHPARVRTLLGGWRGEASVASVPEERKTEGLFADLSTMSNISLLVLNRVSRLGLVRRSLERRACESIAAKVDLNIDYLYRSIDALSGGNQQKAIVGRALATNARYLLMYDPTRGVDIPTKRTLYQVMRDFAEEGGGVLLYSTELTEILNVADRCMVFYAGKIVAEMPCHVASEKLLLAYAMGKTLSEVTPA